MINLQLCVLPLHSEHYPLNLTLTITLESLKKTHTTTIDKVWILTMKFSDFFLLCSQQMHFIAGFHEQSIHQHIINSLWNLLYHRIYLKAPAPCWPNHSFIRRLCVLQPGLTDGHYLVNCTQNDACTEFH